MTFVAVAAACGGGNSYNDSSGSGDGLTSVPPTVTATPEPVSAQDASAVYAAVDALRTKDPIQIRPHVGFRKIGCTTEPAQGGPPMCASGESDGDQIHAFYYGTCEGQYLRPAEIDQALNGLADMEVSGAYRIPKKTESGYEYSIILEDHASTREGYAWEAILDNGEIIGLLFSCSLSPEDLVKLRHYETLVPTPEPTPVMPGS